MSTSPTKSPASNPPIIPDPNNDGKIIRRAFLIEATLNLFTLPLLTHPRLILSHILLRPSSITPSTILFARFFAGIVVFGLTSSLLFGARNTRNGIESRRPTYLLLGLGEAAMLPVLGMEVAKRGGVDAALSVRAAVVSMAMLAPGLVWRVYVCGWRTEWLGRYREVDGKGRGSGSGTKYGAIRTNED
ncbi:hypothetical protein BKA63DRAFT_27817 [Paraphoma chrysanthemicola]|nr:hypothetical protein BKA63DRAFT_27817 [Paraphoma chrysanthemicola]